MTEPSVRFQSPVQRAWEWVWSQQQGVAHALTRFVVLRLFGLVSLMALLTWVNQAPALVGSHGLLPAAALLERRVVFAGSGFAAFVQTPSPYEFKCKPGDPARRPCWMSPYHYRLDWLIWFAAMGEPGQYPWTVHFVSKLLAADPAVLGLLAAAPFGRERPRHVRATLYRYQLAALRRASVWQRTELGPWLPPLSRDDPGLQSFLQQHGWTW